MRNEFLIRKCFKCNKKINDLDPICKHCNSPNKSIQIDKNDDKNDDTNYVFNKGWKERTKEEKMWTVFMILAFIFWNIYRIYK